MRYALNIKEDGDCFSTDSSEKEQKQYSNGKMQSIGNKTESPIRKTKTFEESSNRKSGRKS